MDFQSRIDEDLKTAMKARAAERLSVLRMLKSALKLASIEQGGAEAPTGRSGGAGDRTQRAEEAAGRL